MEKIDDSATTMARAYSKMSGGKACFIPLVWDTGCSKSIISEEAVRGLGIHIEELGKALNIVTASGESLSIFGVADVFIKTQVTGEHRKMIQCCVLRGNKQAPEILVSLERMKALRIIHPTFGKETIDDYLLKNENKSVQSTLSVMFAIQFNITNHLRVLLGSHQKRRLSLEIR